MDTEGAPDLRVLIVEDHAALGDALRMAVDFDPGLECVGVAGTVGQALEWVGQRAPDVVLMDVRLPDGDGIEAVARVKALRPEAAVIVLTAGADSGALLRAADAGASGFLPKETRIAAILQAARRASGGEPVLSPSALQGLLAAARRQEGDTPPAGNGHPLSTAQAELLARLAEGAEPDASRGQLRELAAGLGARSSLEAIVVAARRGLLSG